MDLIRRGDRGTHVLDVQRRLARLGFAVPAGERAGTFGDGTETAIRQFQHARGLLVDGIVGEDTWSELVEASWKLGDRVLYLRAPHLAGDDVRELQDKLGTFGFNVGRIDGIYGAQTDRAVREFQRNYGLPTDGLVAEHTVRALRGLPFYAGDMQSATVRERESMRTRRLGTAGLRIVLDPGHGGTDPGNIGPSGSTEADLCFDLALRIEAGLAASGAHVFLTRRADNGPTDPERAALANTLDAELFLSLHLGSGDGGARGATAFYFGHARYRSEAGAHLARHLLRNLCDIGIADAGTHPKTITVIRETRMPAVFVEAGTITDAAEEKLLTDPAFRARLAAAIADGVRAFAHSVAGA